MSSENSQSITHRLENLDIKPTARMLWVSIPRQELELREEGAPSPRAFNVSTSAKPPSCEENSFGTPTGLHRIARKIGDGAPLGAVFKGRVATGKCYWDLPPGEQEANLVTTRILWLEGLEPGKNKGPGRDSFDRYIYIHGTNHENKIGEPASGGCIQLRNAEMIELHDSVEAGDLVWIEA